MGKDLPDRPRLREMNSSALLNARRQRRRDAMLTASGIRWELTRRKRRSRDLTTSKKEIRHAKQSTMKEQRSKRSDNRNYLILKTWASTLNTNTNSRLRRFHSEHSSFTYNRSPPLWRASQKNIFCNYSNFKHENLLRGFGVLG